MVNVSHHELVPEHTLLEEDDLEGVLEEYDIDRTDLPKIKRRDPATPDGAQPGDVVKVKQGDMVPADIRLLEAQALQVNEAALTGESVPADKVVDAVEEHDLTWQEYRDVLTAVRNAPRLQQRFLPMIGQEVTVTASRPSELDITRGRANGNFRVVGTSANYIGVNNREVEIGRFFDIQENQGRRRVAVLGSAVPEALGVSALEMVGREISIRNISFTVAGVMEEQGSSAGPFSSDEQIFVPVRTAQYRLMGTDEIESFNATVASASSMDMATMQIEEALRRAHRLRPGESNTFWIQNRADILGTFQQTSQTFTYLLAGIAAVSLLVGGIGIMNIMLVSVSERTREIGLRKALGARRRDILVQFLVEALVLCLAGGALGIALGAGASRAFAEFAGWNTLVSPEAVTLAVAFSAAVGIFFGLWPARRASLLDPIEALRYE